VPKSLLALFDVDGTLLVDDAYAHGRAMVLTLREVYGAPIADDAVMQIEPWGKTDLRIARDVLQASGLGNAEIDARLPDWADAAASAFRSEARAARAAWKVRPGLEGALRQLQKDGLRLSLLSGNLRPIAIEKVEQLGLGHYFDVAIGAYGSDLEDRPGLVALARRRGGAPGPPWPRNRTVLVGDTPGDIAAAQSDRVRCAVFSSRRFSAARLGEADAVVSNTAGLVETLRSWQLDGRTE
jgi:phosphoglycolate phosphatase